MILILLEFCVLSLLAYSLDSPIEAINLQTAQMYQLNVCCMYTYRLLTCMNRMESVKDIPF